MQLCSALSGCPICLSTQTRSSMRASHILPRSLPALSTNVILRALAKVCTAEFPSSALPFYEPRNSHFSSAKGVWASLGMAPRYRWVLLKNGVRHKERVTVCSRGPVIADTNNI